MDTELSGNPDTRKLTEDPTLFLHERDRWALVRTEMAHRGLEALVLFGWPAMRDFNIADARYLARSAAMPRTMSWRSRWRASRRVRRPRCRCGHFSSIPGRERSERTRNPDAGCERCLWIPGPHLR